MKTVKIVLMLKKIYRGFRWSDSGPLLDLLVQKMTKNCTFFKWLKMIRITEYLYGSETDLDLGIFQVASEKKCWIIR